MNAMLRKEGYAMTTSIFCSLASITGQRSLTNCYHPLLTLFLLFRQEFSRGLGGEIGHLDPALLYAG